MNLRDKIVSSRLGQVLNHYAGEIARLPAPKDKEEKVQSVDVLDLIIGDAVNVYMNSTEVPNPLLGLPLMVETHFKKLGGLGNIDPDISIVENTVNKPEAKRILQMVLEKHGNKMNTVVELAIKSALQSLDK